jgi:hypothetical protein
LVAPLSDVLRLAEPRSDLKAATTARWSEVIRPVNSSNNQLKST